MGCGYGKVEIWGCLYSHSCHDRCDCRLCISELVFPDFFAYRDDDTFPSDHRTETKRDRYHDDDPVGDSFSATDDTRDIVLSREKCYQYEHSKTDSFLSIIWSMCKADKCARHNKRILNPWFWILIPYTTGMTEEVFIFYIEVKDMHGSKCEHKTNKWRKKKWLKCLDHFMPRKIHILIHEVHDERYSKDRSDKCMWAWCGNTEIPRSEVPYDRSDEEWEYDTNSKCYTRMRWFIGNFIKRKEFHDTNSDTRTTYNHTQKIEKCCEKDCFFRSQRIRIYNGCYGICCIMESIDKFECTYERKTETCEDDSRVHRRWDRM